MFRAFKLGILTLIRDKLKILATKPSLQNIVVRLERRKDEIKYSIELILLLQMLHY